MDSGNQADKKKKITKGVFIKVRVTEKEKNDILSKAESAGRSVSALMRIGIDNIKTQTLTNIENERKIIREVSRIGNNLNQIARICNLIKNDIDRVELLMQLKSIEEEIKSFSPAARF